MQEIKFRFLPCMEMLGFQKKVKVEGFKWTKVLVPADNTHVRIGLWEE